MGHKRSRCPHKAGSSGVNSSPNSTVDSMAYESIGGQTTPKVNIIAVSEPRGESFGGQTTPDVNCTVDLVANESNEGQMIPNVNNIADSEARSEFNGEQMILNEKKERDGNDIASCSRVGQGKNISDKPVEIGESL